MAIASAPDCKSAKKGHAEGEDLAARGVAEVGENIRVAKSALVIWCSKAGLEVELRPPNKSSLRGMRDVRILESAASEYACHGRTNECFNQHPTVISIGLDQI